MSRSNLLVVGIAFLGALCIAFIKITAYIDLKPLGPDDKVDAAVFQSSLVASIGLCGPIFLELIQDMSFVAFTRHQKQNVYVGKMKYFIGRTVLLIGLLIPSSFLLLEIQLQSTYSNRQTLFICCTFIRRLLFMAAVLFCMQSTTVGSPFTIKSTSIIMITYLVAQFCELYNVNQGVSVGNIVMTAFSVIFLVISYSIFAYLVIKWGSLRKEGLIALWKGDSMVYEKNDNHKEETTTVHEPKSVFQQMAESFRGSQKSTGRNTGKITLTTKTPKSNAKVVPEEFYELGILILAFVACISSHVVDGQHSWKGSTEWGVIDSSLKAGYTYLAMLFTSFMSALLGRHARIAIIIDKENSLDEKKSFVRYISHEIRTPLNTVCMGLDYLADGMKKSTNPLDIERVETIDDISSSCRVALSILNDLLNIDKLESGTLMLERKLEPMLPFVSDAMQAFKLQAVKQRVTMELDYSLEKEHEDLVLSRAELGGGGLRSSISSIHSNQSDGLQFGLPVMEDDCSNIDKNKFGQVIRNLLSNALKFTKGRLTVRMRSVECITLSGLQETEDFKNFGKVSIWEMIHTVMQRKRLQEGFPAKSLVPVPSRGWMQRQLSGQVQISSSHSVFSGGSGGSVTATPATGAPQSPPMNMLGLGVISATAGGGVAGVGGKLDPIVEHHHVKSKGNRGSMGSMVNHGEYELVDIESGMYSQLHSGTQTPVPKLPSVAGVGVGGGISPVVEGHKTIQSSLQEGLKQGATPRSFPSKFKREESRRRNDDSITSGGGRTDKEATRMLVIEVIDDGVGMPPEYLNRIFNEVLQINPGELQQGGGSGLGLVLTKGIVEQHGGCISVFSAGLNTGCTFTILLPMFKPGNEKLEAMNREDASTANRRIFMNRFLEGKDQSRSGDLDLVPHGGEFVVPTTTSPRPNPQVAGNATSMKILPVGSSSRDMHGDLNFDETNRGLLPSVSNNALNIPLLTSGKGLVGQLGTFVLGGGSRQNTSRGDVTGRGDTTGRGDKSPHRHVNSSPAEMTNAHDDQTGLTGRSEGTTQPNRFSLPISNKEVVDSNAPLSPYTPDIVVNSPNARTPRLEPIVPNHVTPVGIPSTLKEHLLTLEKLRILIVDDSAMNRKMLTKLLVGRGHHCFEAKHGAEAVEKVDALFSEHQRRIKEPHENKSSELEDSKPREGDITPPPLQSSSYTTNLYDIILMDYVMPVMDGPSATSEIRKLGYTGMIIGVTGNGLPSDISHFISKGASCVLTKPFNLDEFHTQILKYACAL